MGLAVFKVVAGIVDAAPRRSEPANHTNNVEERESIGTEGHEENKDKGWFVSPNTFPEAAGGIGVRATCPNAFGAGNKNQRANRRGSALRKTSTSTKKPYELRIPIYDTRPPHLTAYIGLGLISLCLSSRAKC